MAETLVQRLGRRIHLQPNDASVEGGEAGSTSVEGDVQRITLTESPLFGSK